MSLDKKISMGAPGAQAEEIVKVEYDFAVDAGAVADYDVLENTGVDPMVVELDRIDVETAMTSATAPLIDLGKGDGGTEFISDAQKGVFSADAMVISDIPGTKVELINGEKIVMGVEVAAITAGKMVFVFKIQRRSHNE